MRVLHVVECYEAGAGNVVNEITKRTTDVEHHLLYAGRDDPHQMGNFTSIMRLRDGLKARYEDVRRTIRTVEPGVIHAHSSWAGVYTRVVPTAIPIVYQPHCYAFEDVGRSRAQRMFIRAIESLLAGRTDLVVAVSRREARLAAAIRPSVPVQIVPNPPTVAVATECQRRNSDSIVAMIGRISPQKDPGFFSETARRCRALGVPASFVWIGDGEPASRRQLEESGVRVTGWIGADEVAGELDRAAIYFHSARYEGFPLSVINAAARLLPVVVRRISAFDGTELTSAEDPSEAAGVINNLLDDDLLYESAIQQSRRINETSDPEVFGRALDNLYDRVIGSAALSGANSRGIPGQRRASEMGVLVDVYKSVPGLGTRKSMT